MNVKLRYYIFSIALLYLLVSQSHAQIQKRKAENNVVAELQVVCQSDSIVLKVNTNTAFNGMVYAKDAPNSSGCVSEFQSSTNMTYRLPLKSCGTLFSEVDDGIEYFNTVMIQPHMRLMTNQAKGYHIRCKYQTRERTIANTHFNVSASFPMQNGPQSAPTPLLATASMPSCTMKIFRSGRDDVAEAVKIGDKLIMVIEIDQQDMYGMRITNCLVRDGLNVAEQQLINDVGCPIDETVMPKFEYSHNSTRATVSFPAHKFPHTSSIYYQCNVRLCINNGGCEQPDCSATASAQTAPNGGPRRKRFVNHAESHGVSNSVGIPQNYSIISPQQANLALPEASALKASTSAEENGGLSFDVYSGLYVNDADVAESGSSDANTQQVLPAHHSDSRANEEPTEEVCLTMGKASLIVLAASMVSVGIIMALLCQIGIFGRDQSSRTSPIISDEYHHVRANYYGGGAKGANKMQHHLYRHGGCDTLGKEYCGDRMS